MISVMPSDMDRSTARDWDLFLRALGPRLAPREDEMQMTDERGQIIEWDTDARETCRHALDPDNCADCRAEFEAERIDYQRWRASQPPVETEGIEDLPF